MSKDVERREFQQMVKDRHERVDRPRVKAEIAAVGTTEVKTYGTDRPPVRKTGRYDRGI